MPSMEPTSYQLTTAVWLAAPTSQEVAAHYPKEQLKGTVGHVVLHCYLDAVGGLKSCTPLQETPKGAGLGKAALDLSKTFRTDVSSYKDRLPLTFIDVPFHFLDPESADWLHRTIAKPRWVAAPSVEDVEAAFPAKAKAAGVFSGLGRMDCLLAVGGKFSDCRLVAETPPDLGFGPAALQLISKLAMNPWTVEGLPTDGTRLVVPLQVSIEPPTPPTKP